MVDWGFVCVHVVKQVWVLAERAEPAPTLQHRLNRLELEHAYLAEQNAHLIKELSFARYTIHALKNITTQKDTALQASRQELDRAYFRIRMLGMTLLRQEQQLKEQEFDKETREQDQMTPPESPRGECALPSSSSSSDTTTLL
ncbi:hypothetical protein BJV82DRAFT_151720 [Fennellomyces sp. T-0311]|nr:hypothetical protein BJV82DRAFT_151720 [Fennellomyces sp. T-0311]